jgi:hypothetical protein
MKTEVTATSAKIRTKPSGTKLNVSQGHCRNLGWQTHVFRLKASEKAFLL